MTKSKKYILTILIALIIIIFIAITYLIMQKPPTPVKPPVDNRVNVNVTKIEYSNYTPIIEVLGKVEAADSLNLMAEVSGKVVKVNKDFVPGGIIKKDDIILEIDSSDYNIALSEAKVNYTKAEANYKRALGRSAQAEEELKLYEKNSGKKIKNSYLALRKPELEQAKSDLELAKSNLAKAKLNLDRTKIKASYNLIVKEKNVSYGSFVGAGAVLASLVNIDCFWINVSVPIKQMAYMDFKPNSVAEVKSNTQQGVRKATFFKLLNYLDNNARFMGILYVINDPLLLKPKSNNSNKVKKNNEENLAPKIFLEDYVNVSIKGKELKKVVKIPLYTLKNNNIVWVAKEGKLIFVPVEVIYKDTDNAYVRGLAENDEIIISDLSLATNNMPIKVKTTH